MNRLSSLILAAALLSPASAMAQSQLESTLPTLSRIGQMVVVEPSLANAQASADCGIDVKATQAMLAKILTEEKLPIVSAGAGTGNESLQRVTVRPDIATLKDGVVNCVSYVSVRVETGSSLVLPPLTEKKSIVAILWLRGGLILTPVIDHKSGVSNAFNILARGVAKQYHLDNPDAPAPVAADPLAGIRK